MDTEPISFPDWKSVLTHAGLSDADEAAYRREIISLLKYCKTQHVPVTVRLAKQYVEQQEQLGAGPVRVALRWFVRAARQAGETRPAKRDGAVGPASARSVEARRTAEPAGEAVPAPAAPGERPRRILRPMEPKPARDDLGGPDWEQALVKTMRLRGLLWRTEYSYRSWAKRFAQFIAPKTPYAAGAEEVQAFLTELATQGRASASGQRQALCALVFVTTRPAVRAPRAVTLRFAPGQPLTQTAG